MSERRIPGGLKDEHGVYRVLGGTPAPSTPQPKPYVEPMRHDVSLDDLISRCLLVLWREVYNLQEASSGGQKLNEEQAKELRENTRLLVELKKKEKELLDELTDEELAELARIQGRSSKSTRSPRKAKNKPENSET